MLANKLGKVVLKEGKESVIKSKHPWIFSGAIDRTENIIKNGQLVLVTSYKDEPLAIGSFSISSQISVRIWSFDTITFIDKNFLNKRISLAYSLRKNILDFNSTNSYRLINSESDLIPGLIVDNYNGHFVVQFLSAGVEYFRKELIDIISQQNNCKSIYERSDTDSRKKENLKIANRLLYGTSVPDKIIIKENSINFYVDIINGHKTGFYLDQRDNRLLLQQFAGGKNILNCFSYTGGFSVYALTGGANSVINVDSSRNSLDLSEENHKLNNISKQRYKHIEADVFKLLRNFRNENKKFDLIILDPPKFTETSASKNQAARGYKDINLLAMKLLNEDRILFTFSCSGHISRELFQKIVSDAALDSGKVVKFISFLTQSIDHPVLSTFPESLYLKGLVCLVNSIS